jgi:hypothetical protein
VPGRWRGAVAWAALMCGSLAGAALGENPVGGTADAFLELTGLWLVALGAFLLTLRRGLEGR